MRATVATPVVRYPVEVPSSSDAPEEVGGIAGLKEKAPFFPACPVQVPPFQSAFACTPSSSNSSVNSSVVAGLGY